MIVQIEDNVTDESLDPPRPWQFSPLIFIVRNGCAIVYWALPDEEAYRTGKIMYRIEYEVYSGPGLNDTAQSGSGTWD